MSKADSKSGAISKGSAKRRYPRRPRDPRKPKGKPRGKPWKKGQSGNPAGRPKASPEYRTWLDETEPLAFQAITDIITDPAHPKRGELSQYVVNRKRGRPTDRVELGGTDGKPLEAEFPNLLGALKKLAGDGTGEADGAGAATPEGETGTGEG
jgi:hypothetical protein